MIFSEWDEALTHQDPQKEKEALYQQLINDNNVLFLLDIAKQLDKSITNLEEEYGTKAAELAEIPFNRLIRHILDICKVTNLDIKANNINHFKLNYL
ncbi:hypothetical protein [Ectobacillus panaciterrae]|uniref:hypothetical protein n=1 Tax=Ectobacillus panaciterrae TaxID=363872 RepID=UPI00041D69B8|nr:hypothetical protein [Ectobacillus panaciterrae]